MPTIAIDQLVEQTRPSAYAGRIWRITRITDDEIILTLVGPRTRGTDHVTIGDQRFASPEWLDANTRDYTPPRLDPPQGDGPQCIRIVDGNDIVLDERQHTLNIDMLGDVRDVFEGDDDPDDLRVLWFGYHPDSDDDVPDMYAEWVNGEVVWQDAQ